MITPERLLDIQAILENRSELCSAKFLVEDSGEFIYFVCKAIYQAERDLVETSLIYNEFSKNELLIILENIGTYIEEQVMNDDQVNQELKLAVLIACLFIFSARNSLLLTNFTFKQECHTRSIYDDIKMDLQMELNRIPLGEELISLLITDNEQEDDEKCKKIEDSNVNTKRGDDDAK